MNLHLIQEYIFDFFIAVSWIILVMLFLGVFHEKPHYFHNIEIVMKIYVGFFLMIRYNPFNVFGLKFKFTELDRKIIFSAGLIILSTTLIKEYLYFIKDLNKSIKDKENISDEELSNYSLF